MNKIKLFSLMAFTSVVLAGCAKISDFKLPSSVAVKTSDAEYNFTVADLQNSDILAKNFNVSDMISKMTNSQQSSGEGSGDSSSAGTESANMNFYVYNPEGASDTLQMAMGMSLKEIQLDFNQYLDKADIANSIQTINIPSQSITVPEVSKEFSQALTIENIDEKINSICKFFGESKKDYQNIDISIEETGYDFNSISYESGFLVISTMSTDTIRQKFPNSPILQALERQAEQYLGIDPQQEPFEGNIYIKTVGSDEPLVVPFDENGRAEIPLTNSYFYKHGMAIKFDDPNKYYFAEIKPGSKINAADGLCIPTAVGLDIDPQTVELAGEAMLKSCVIGEGNLELELAAEGWENVHLEYDINLKQGNGGVGDFNITLSKSLESELDEPVSHTLNSVPFRYENLYFSGRASIKLDNSTIVFKNKPVITGKVEINKISEAVVVMDSKFNIDPISQTYELPKEVITYVNKIKWAPSGIKINYNNSLPARNKIDVKVNSSFLGLHDFTREISSGENNVLPILCDDDLITKFGDPAVDPERINSVDFTAEITLEGYDKATNTLTVYDVECNHKYDISMSADPVFDWKEIYINSNVAEQKGFFNTGMNLGSFLSGNDMLKNLVEKVNLTKVPMFLYCDIPTDLFDGLGFKGSIRAYLADKDDKAEEPEPIEGTNPIYFLGDAENTASLVPCSQPELVTNDAGELTTIFTNSSIDIEETKMAELINASLAETNSVLCMNYNIGFGSDPEEGAQTGDDEGIKITNEMFNRLKDSDGPTAIKISAVVVLPLEFEIKGGESEEDNEGLFIDIASLISSNNSSDSGEGSEGSEGSESTETDTEKDLLGRSGEDSVVGKIEQYLEAIESVGFELSISKMPIDAENGVMFVVDLDGKERTVNGQARGGIFAEKEISLKKGKYDIPVHDVLQANPLVPTYGVRVAPGKFSLKRDMGISLNAKLNLKTKPNYIISFGSGNSSGSEEE